MQIESYKSKINNKKNERWEISGLAFVLRANSYSEGEMLSVPLVEFHTLVTKERKQCFHWTNCIPFVLVDVIEQPRSWNEINNSK